MAERSSSSPASASQDDALGLSDASPSGELPDAGNHPVGSNKRLRTAYSAAALAVSLPLSKSES